MVTQYYLMVPRLPHRRMWEVYQDNLIYLEKEKLPPAEINRLMCIAAFSKNYQLVDDYNFWFCDR